MSTETMTVSIAGREYPLKMKPDEIALIKKAEAAISECINVYEKNFAVKDKQDILAMCLLNFATQLQQNATGNENKIKFEQQLEETELYLTKYLNTLVL